MTKSRDPTGDACDVADHTRERLRAYLDALANGGDPRAHVSDDAVLTVMETGEQYRGRDDVVAFLDYLQRRAFSAAHVVTSLHADGGHGFVEAEFVGRHVGEFAGHGPTGRSVRVPYAFSCDLDADAIIALRLYLPLDALVRQIRRP